MKIGEKNTGYPLFAKQIPASLVPRSKTKDTPEGLSKIDIFVENIRTVKPQFQQLDIHYIVADAFFAKFKYVDGVTAEGFHVIGKLRKDANLLQLFDQESTQDIPKKRGRPRKSNGIKITTQDFQNFITVVKAPDISFASKIVYCPSMKRKILVVLVRKNISLKIVGEALLFSTDLQQDPVQVLQFYAARFQIEFVFRDAKGFVGFGDCQSRDAKRLNYHFNASLMSLNILKIEDVMLHKNEANKMSFSAANLSRKYTIRIMLNLFIEMFDLDQTLIKSNPNYEKILAFGAIGI